MMREPGPENATQPVDQGKPDQHTASASHSCDYVRKEQPNTFHRRPSPNWETVQPLAPVEQIASFNPVRRRRWKLVLFIGLCFSGTAVVGLVTVPGLLSHYRLGIVSVTASDDIHFIQELPTAPLITVRKHEPILSQPVPVQTRTHVATSIAAMPAEQSEVGAPFSFDARTSSSITAEPPTPTVQTLPAAAAGTDAFQKTTDVSPDVQTSLGELPEPTVVSVLERPPKTIIGAPTYTRPSVEAPVVRSEPNTIEPRITKTEADALLSRGDTLLRAGDVTSARLYYQKGAEAGDGTAALRLGETFDPEFLKRAHLSLVRSDAEKAVDWYRRAAELDNPDAKLLLGNISMSGR
jgi:hypothetical protein